MLIAAGLVLVLRYLWYMDDAFVYFRYAENFAVLGRGLVYNHGDFVEGFTSPLWVLLLSAGRALGLAFPVVVTAVAVAAYLAFGAALVGLNRRLSPVGAPVVDLPLAALALHYGVLCYFSSGLESPLVHLVALGVAWAIVAPRAALPQLVVALAPLVRPELATASAVVWAWSWARTRRFPWRLTAFGALFGGGWMLFRVWYYAELLPVPFHLKDTTWWAQGLAYLSDATWTYGFHLLLPGGLLLLLVARRRGLEARTAERLVMLLVAALVATYVVRVGGDARHFRYLAFPYVLATVSLAGLVETVVGARASRASRVALPAAAVVLAVVTASRYPTQLDEHPALRPAAVAHASDGIQDATTHRGWGLITQVVDSGPESLDEAEVPRGEPFAYHDAVIGPYCVLHYRFLHDRAVHSLGLTEPVLARMDAPAARPGHRPDLMRFAPRLEALRAEHGREPGSWHLALSADDAPDWVADNLAALEVLARRRRNRHDLAENWRLALEPVGVIAVAER